MVTIRLATTRDLANAERLYADLGYRARVEPTDRLVLAETEARLVGLVRLAHEHAATVLRGMRVVPSHQRRGIGTALLRVVEEEVESAPCYGIAYHHLRSFYAQIGFREATSPEAPSFLADRLAQYRAERPEASLYLMIRRPGGVA